MEEIDLFEVVSLKENSLVTFAFTSNGIKIIEYKTPAPVACLDDYVEWQARKIKVTEEQYNRLIENG